MVSTSYAETIDLSILDIEELESLKSRINYELFSRPESQGIKMEKGEYRVGTDILPGKYHIRNLADSSYNVDVVIYTDSSMTSLLYKEAISSISNKDYIIVLDTENILIIDGIIWFNNSTFPNYAAPEGTTIPNGIYVVGEEIPEGKYTAYYKEKPAQLNVYQDQRHFGAGESLFSSNKMFSHLFSLNNSQFSFSLKNGNIVEVLSADIIVKKVETSFFNFDDQTDLKNDVQNNELIQKKDQTIKEMNLRIAELLAENEKLEEQLLEYHREDSSLWKLQTEPIFSGDGWIITNQYYFEKGSLNHYCCILKNICEENKIISGYVLFLDTNNNLIDVAAISKTVVNHGFTTIIHASSSQPFDHAVVKPILTTPKKSISLQPFIEWSTQRTDNFIIINVKNNSKYNADVVRYNMLCFDENDKIVFMDYGTLAGIPAGESIKKDIHINTLSTVVRVEFFIDAVHS